MLEHSQCAGERLTRDLRHLDCFLPALTDRETRGQEQTLIEQCVLLHLGLIVFIDLDHSFNQAHKLL